MGSRVHDCAAVCTRDWSGVRVFHDGGRRVLCSDVSARTSGLAVWSGAVSAVAESARDPWAFIRAGLLGRRGSLMRDSAMTAQGHSAIRARHALHVPLHVPMTPVPPLQTARPQGARADIRAEHALAPCDIVETPLLSIVQACRFP